VLYKLFLSSESWIKFLCNYYNDKANVVQDLSARLGKNRSPLSHLIEEATLKLVDTLEQIKELQPSILNQYRFLIRGGADAVVHKVWCSQYIACTHTHTHTHTLSLSLSVSLPLS
jgi:hypothetical protein